MNKSESIIELAKALSKFQGEVKQPKKNGKNPHFKSSFATLDDVVKSITETAHKYGLSFMQFPVNENELVGVKTIILHDSGEYIEGETIYTKPMKNDPQALGSVVSYLKRYSLSAIFGIVSDEDDDSEGAMNRQPTPPPKQQPKPTPPKPAKLVMPKDANEAWNMIVPDMFTKHKGKTLGAVWKEDMPYIGQMLSLDKSPIEITEGITLIQVAMAAKAAKEKQGE